MEAMNFARLRWACRRGMLELDLIFEPYVETAYRHASLEEQRQFEALLEWNDQELYDCLVKREPPKDLKMQPMIQRLLAHAQL